MKISSWLVLPRECRVYSPAAVPPCQRDVAVGVSAPAVNGVDDTQEPSALAKAVPRSE